MNPSVGHESGPGQEPEQSLHKDVERIGAQVGLQKQRDAQMGHAQPGQEQYQADRFLPDRTGLHDSASSSRRSSSVSSAALRSVR